MGSNNLTFNRRSLLAFASMVTASGFFTKSALGQTPVEGTPVPGGVFPPEITGAADTDWVVEGRTLSQERWVTGSSISTETVTTLTQAWTKVIETSSSYGALVANPIIYGDTLYLQDSSSNVMALNRETGEEIWTNSYNQAVPSGGPNGAAIGYGIIVYPVGNGGVVAADLKTGEEVWSIDITGPKGEGITTAPLIYNNQVWISTVPGSVDAFYLGGMRGMIYVIDVATGAVLWYFDTVDENLWGNPSVNSGGGFWHPPAVNANGEMFFSIANAAPYPGTEEYPSGSSRPGDNDYANNVLKIDPNTGELIWHTNVTGRDIFDSDNHLSPIVGTVVWPEDGYSRELIFATGKHAFVVALDPETGEIFWKVPVGTHRNEQIQVIPDEGETEVRPRSGALTPFAYADNAVYVALFENTRTVTPSKDVSAPLTEGPGKVVALDATTGSILWDTDLPSGALGGATVVNDLVFTGGLDGRIRAYNTADGTLAWSMQTAAGINAPLAISGDYLYVPAGGPLIASEETEDVGEQQAQLIAYKLG
jgi:outer membrane protein assembly factor BamB